MYFLLTSMVIRLLITKYFCVLYVLGQQSVLYIILIIYRPI